MGWRGTDAGQQSWHWLLNLPWLCISSLARPCPWRREVSCPRGMSQPTLLLVDVDIVSSSPPGFEPALSLSLRSLEVCEGSSKPSGSDSGVEAEKKTYRKKNCYFCSGVACTTDIIPWELLGHIPRQPALQCPDRTISVGPGPC